MTIERDYYEIEYFWNEQFDQGEHERIRRTAGYLPEEGRTLLDVGCGNGAFVNHLASQPGCRYQRICGVDRSRVALQYVKGEKQLAEVDALPFKDGEFDVVTCLEVVEHLPEAVYSKALGELARVAGRYVVLSVPHNEWLRGNLVTCPDCRTRFNPNYHMRSFTRASMTGLLEPHGFRAERTDLFGEYLLFTRYMNFFRTGNPFRVAIPCPLCGHALPGRGGDVAPAAADPSPAPRRGVRALVRALWPQRRNWARLVTVYRRT